MILEILPYNCFKIELYKELVDFTKFGKPAWYIRNIDDSNVNTLCRFSLRNHKLAIEEGSWHGTAKEKRVCFTCGVMEDELHFILQCPRYDLHYAKYLNSYGRQCAKTEDLVTLLTCDNAKQLNNLGIFLKKATIIVHSEYRAMLNVVAYP